MTANTRELPRRVMVPLFLVLSVGPLAMLAYFSVTLASEAVRHRVKDSLAAEASLSALYVREELQGLAEVNQSFARRPVLIRALAAGPGRYDLTTVRRNLVELSRVRPGIGTTFLARPDGRLIDIVPPTPSIVGKDFSFRDWYRGVTRTGGPYVSEAYQTQATNHVNVVGVAALVRARSSASRIGREFAILVLAYRLSTIQSIVSQFSLRQGLGLTITDQRGTVLASPRTVRSHALGTLARDPMIEAALRGHSGVGEGHLHGLNALFAWAPISGLGWGVLASIPSSRAFADVARLRRAVLLISTLLGLVLLAGVWLLNRALLMRQRAQEQMHRVAHTDVLTSLPNRRAWEESLPRELARARRDGQPLTVAMIDLDNFKHFNDTRGHQAGDELLASAASAWVSQLRETDVLARYGGEEFTLALPQCSAAAAEEVLNRLHRVIPDGQTCSIGSATWDGQEDGDALVSRADNALYEAKRAGRDCTVSAPEPNLPRPNR